MSQEVDFSEFRRVFENLEGVKDQIPEIKKEMLDQLGGEMLSVVRRNIGGEGKVKSWQEYYIGSRHGYSAVRPKADTYLHTKGVYQTTENDKFAVGHVTNAIETGHRIRSPSGQATGRYRPRIHQPRIPGRYFYRSSQSAVDRLAENGAKDLAEKIARKIEEAAK